MICFIFELSANLLVCFSCVVPQGYWEERGIEIVVMDVPHTHGIFNFFKGGYVMNTRKSSFEMILLLAGLFCVWLTTGAQAADRVVVVPLGGGKPLQNVITVAKAGGKFTNPVAAMNSITDASATNPYLILIAPGQYTLTSALVMKPFVNVSGCGETVTWLIGAISSSNINETSAIVKGANNTTLSNLSVSNTGGGENSFGIFTTGLNVTARLQQLSVYAKGGETNAGVLNYNSSSPFISGVNIAVQGIGVQVSIGIYNVIGSSPTMLGVNALVCGGTANMGVYNVSNSSPLIDGANILVWGAAGDDIGVSNRSSNNVTIRRSTISGDTDGLSNSTSTNTRVSQSTVINGVS